MAATTTATWTRVTGTANEYSRDDMLAAFNAVQDKANWKMPIAEQWVPWDRLMVTVAAIAYFAGSPTDILPDADQAGWRIKAPGYYASVGA